MKYGELTLGQMEALVNKLGGMEGVKRFLSGESVVRMAERIFPVWKTIKLGIGLKTANDFRRALKEDGHHISDWANDILGKRAFTASKTEMEVDLVSVTVAELGFGNGATRENIYKQALELGLELCPAEVGPQLRLQYRDQPLSEWQIIAMEPITGSDGSPSVLYVGCGAFGSWLRVFCGSPDDVWYGSDRWVFVRGK
jgi:hypothetical protein